MDRRCKKGVLKYGEYFACGGTHPQMPNYSGHSRGRKRHLTADRKHTLCNLLVDILIPEWNTFARNGVCDNCSKIAKQANTEEKHDNG